MRMLADQELQSLRNLGNEDEAAADEIVMLRAVVNSLADCRTCEYLAGTRCAAALRCAARSSYKAAAPLTLWEAAPSTTPIF
jgi:hypothetical protein